MRIEENREHRLDSLRGLAALAVAAGHCVTSRSLDTPQYAKTFLDLDYGSLTAVVLRLLHIVFNAEAAIIVFFVLSGYVLAKSLRRMGPGLVGEFTGFAIKRVYRIVPAVIVSFLPLAYFVDRSGWEYVRNMLLLQASINGVTWTLQIEMLGSVLIFLTVLLAKKNPYLLIPLFILLVVMFLSDYEWIFFRHFPAFFFGCFVGEIRRYLKGNDAIAVASIVVLATADFLFPYGSRNTVVLETVAAVFLIASVSSSRAMSFLDWRVFRFLGRISFSFYLYHFLATRLVLTLFAAIGFDLGVLHRVPSALVYMAASIPVAVVLGTISFYLVERPSIDAGLKLAQTARLRLSPRSADLTPTPTETPTAAVPHQSE
jgi:peptidoglycan/LPS O-acetylase OafA/YrhL